MEKPNGESCLAGILTVVVDNVNRVLIFWEADGVASGDGQQRHTSQQQREPHDRQGRGPDHFLAILFTCTTIKQQHNRVESTGWTPTGWTDSLLHISC